LADAQPTLGFHQPDRGQLVAEFLADPGQPDGGVPRGGLAPDLRPEQGFDMPADAFRALAVGLAQPDRLAAPVRGHEQDAPPAARVIRDRRHDVNLWERTAGGGVWFPGHSPAGHIQVSGVYPALTDERQHGSGHPPPNSAMAARSSARY